MAKTELGKFHIVPMSVETEEVNTMQCTVCGMTQEREDIFDKHCGCYMEEIWEEARRENRSMDI